MNITKKLLKYVLRHQEPYDVKVNGIDITVFPKVFPPISPYSYDSIPLAAKNDACKDDVVLDIGAGTGIQAIASALNGAKEVVAIDISEHAVQNCLYNIKKHGLERKIKVIKGDLFKNIPNKKKFSLIIVNLPFVDNPTKNFYEKWVFDPGFCIHRTFFANVKKYLAKNGRILMAYSDVGNVKLFENLAKKTGLSVSKIAEEKKIGFNWYIYRMASYTKL